MHVCQVQFLYQLVGTSAVYLLLLGAAEQQQQKNNKNNKEQEQGINGELTATVLPSATFFYPRTIPPPLSPFLQAIDCCLPPQHFFPS